MSATRPLTGALRAAASAMDDEAAIRERNIGHISVAQAVTRDVAVLRATADLLRDSANCIEYAEADRSPDDTCEITDVHALAVARAFMGGTA